MENKLYNAGQEKFGIVYILFENILLITQFFFGFLGMKLFTFKGIPVYSYLYVLFLAVMLLYFLRKHLCTHCYYFGKNCHCGWGKLASTLFKEKSGTIQLGGKVAGPTWGIIMTVPLLSMILALFFNIISFYNLVPIFIPYILLVFINGFLHVKDCKNCKMRYTCPGSAAK